MAYQTPDPDLAARCIQTAILVGFGARRQWAIRVARRLPEFSRWWHLGLLDDPITMVADLPPKEVK